MGYGDIWCQSRATPLQLVAFHSLDKAQNCFSLVWKCYPVHTAGAGHVENVWCLSCIDMNRKQES